jgi:hypothetical protein
MHDLVSRRATPSTGAAAPAKEAPDGSTDRLNQTRYLFGPRLTPKIQGAGQCYLSALATAIRWHTSPWLYDTLRIKELA